MDYMQGRISNIRAMIGRGFPPQTANLATVAVLTSNPTDHKWDLGQREIIECHRIIIKFVVVGDCRSQRDDVICSVWTP